MPTPSTDFDEVFRSLTGNSPLSWQRRFYKRLTADGGQWPATIDLPTGMGKTMAMAIWLITRHLHPELQLPTRLIYVVDRRTVVDQATDLAEKLRGNSKKYLSLAVSTLRGHLADNREWSKDPARPAIIIGTVDLIGSALLFSGYRSSYKRRPLEAGLLGQDSLLLLDEAHLSRPFAKLLDSVGAFQASHGKPMRVCCMSATTGQQDRQSTFDLTPDDLNTDSTVLQRFSAEKRLSIKPICDKEKLTDALADAAIALAYRADLQGKRIVVFVRKPDQATEIGRLIRAHVPEPVEEPGQKRKRIKATPPFLGSVEVLTGTMRGLERDELVLKDVFKHRWLNGDIKPEDSPNRSPVFLISTSAGEVGFDLNGDHMVSDGTTIDSLIQRLGRVNRRGLGAATVEIRHESIKTTDKEGKPRKLEAIEAAIATTLQLLSGVTDVSPKNIAFLKGADQWKGRYEAACSPEPKMATLTDILLDAWSMTSVTEPMPGRPEVGPWLRGTEPEQAQTTVAWRAEVDVFKHLENAGKVFAAVFTKHPIRPHESVTLNTNRVIDFLKVVTRPNGGRADLVNVQVVVKLFGRAIVKTIGDLIEQPGILYAEPTLILPARFGGLNAGMLSAEAIPDPPNLGDPLPPSWDVADKPDYEPQDGMQARLRLVIQRTELGGWRPTALDGGDPLPGDLALVSEYDRSKTLFDALKKAGFSIRLVQPMRLNVEGDVESSVLFLSPFVKRKGGETQTLTYHVAEVEGHAKRVADGLKLRPAVREAVMFAAKWHDEGKKAEIWQRFVYGPDANGNYLGKAVETRSPQSLGGYRHEFGSLLRLHYPPGGAACTVPANSEMRDLALHLIATHHGCSRPYFLHPMDREFKDEQCDCLHRESIRRFAGLQRRYGWWHLAWLENLLRCADALASATDESEDDPTEADL